MPTQIKINPDQTVSVLTPRGLTGITAGGCAEYVNALDAVQLTAAIMAARAVPFPCGNGETCYREILASMDGPNAHVAAKARSMPLGELRKGAVMQAGSGMNAPTDSYLRIAFDIATGKECIHRY